MKVAVLIDCEGSFATMRDVIVGHFHGVGRFERAGKGFRWAVE